LRACSISWPCVWNDDLEWLGHAVALLERVRREKRRRLKGGSGGYARAGVAPDKLDTYAVLLQWGVLAGTLSKERARRLVAMSVAHPSSAARMLHRTKRLREALHGVFHPAAHSHGPVKGALEFVNAEIGNALSHARIASGGRDFTWDWTDENPLDFPLWDIARDAGDLLASERLVRLRECEGDTCGWLFLNLTKNGSRRWCDMKGCGNRAKVRRYRAAKHLTRIPGVCPRP
jgi:predicted RNA-binding Zn ribbon-like protein